MSHIFRCKRNAHIIIIILTESVGNKIHLYA